jgi:hypothetical protein
MRQISNEKPNVVIFMGKKMLYIITLELPKAQIVFIDGLNLHGQITE